MKSVAPRVIIFLCVLVAGSAATLPAAARQAAGKAAGHDASLRAGRSINVLFLGHESTHHPSDSAAAYLVPALAGQGFNFQYSTTPDDLNAANLARFDALILYANHDSISPSQESALMDFVESGHGFVPIHSASYCFRNSDRVVAMMGGQFAQHGTGTFTAEIIRPDHPIMQGLEPFETWDETYVHTKHNPQNRTVLMERVDDEGREPYTWTRTQGDGRVFYTALGHDGRTWRQSAFHALIRNGLLWAVGDEVRAQWEALDLPPLEYSETSWIPNYERRNPPLKYQEPLEPEASMQHIQVPPGFELQLFAAEPDIAKPIAMAWDERGRLWIAETVDYPNDIHPGTPGNDRIKILEDTDGDGRADKFTVFADGLNVPTALTFAAGGLVVAEMPNLVLLKDTNGDDRADAREVLASGFGYRDTHAGPSNLRYGFDNWIWGAVGYSSFDGVVGGDSLRFGQAIYRIRPDGARMEHVANFSNNTWGLGFSETGDVFGSTANNTHAVYVGIPRRYSADMRNAPARFGAEQIDGHYAMAAITPNVRQVDVFGGFTAAAGFEVYTARAYPREYWNRIAFVTEPTGGVVHRAILEPDDAGYTEHDGWNLLASTDEWVGPVDAQVGPDGQVWVADWYNFIIQHNPTPPGFENGAGNAYVNPLRDKEHGRIYRVVYTGGSASDAQTSTQQSMQPSSMTLSPDDPDALVRALNHPNRFWRMTAQRLLVERGNTDVASQLIELVGSHETDALGLSPGPLHALWTLHGLGLIGGKSASDATDAANAAVAAAISALRHPVAAVRKAAAQVLPADDALLGRLRDAGLLADPNPHTRLAVLLRLTEVEPSAELGAMLYAMSTDADVMADQWLADAVYVAASHHRAGFLEAYEAALGKTEFDALTARLVEEESTPRRFDYTVPGAWEESEAALAAAAARPAAERLLRAYLEEVVGPFDRAEVERGWFGGRPSDDPVLDITISALENGQLKFDVTRFEVKPRQRVRLTFVNPDVMQHNLLLLRPGTTHAVGALADAMLATPDAADRGYVPPTPDVMRFTPLVEPGESAVLEFVAPRDAGEYPYLCTFPGHWRLMQGVMVVAE